MKKLTVVMSSLLAVVLVAAGCASSSSTGPIQVSLTKDGVAAMQVIQAYWAAFNKFDLNGCVACFDPASAQKLTANAQSDLNDFQAGKSMGVQMVVYSVTQAGVLADGRLDLRVDMQVTPKGLSVARYLMYYMTRESDGSWKISTWTLDPDKTPPRAVSNLTFNVVGSSEVDITWKASYRATSYRIDRALDSSYQNEPVSVTLPAGTTSYNDTTVVPGTKYWYRVVSISKGGQTPSQNWPVTVPAAS